MIFFEFKKKLFFGKGGPDTEQFQKRITFDIVVERACGSSPRIGGGIGGTIVPVESFRLHEYLGDGVRARGHVVD